MTTLIIELHRLATEAQHIGSHLHLGGTLRIALGAVLAQLRKAISAAGGPRVVLKQALHLLEQRVEHGTKAWPEILREAADLVEHAQEENDEDDKQANA